MSGVFLSYSRPNRDLAAQVATALRALGVEVWWDEDMPGVDWQAELERQIKTLTAVVVLWTPASVNSVNVKDEARLAQHHNKLINLMSGVKEPPFPFDRGNGLPLDGWTGVDRHSGWTRLIKTVEDYLVQAGVSQAGALTSVLADREKLIRARQKAIATAQEAHQTAQAEEEAAIAAGRQAVTALAEAQEQLRGVAKIGGSMVVMRAAQVDVDNALAAKEAAEANRKAASGAVSKTARALTTAQARFNALFDEAPEQAPVPDPIDQIDETPTTDTVPSPEPVDPVPPPKPVPPAPPKPPVPPRPIPSPKPAGTAFWNFVGFVALIAIIALVTNHFKPKPKPMVSPEVAAGFDSAVASLSKGAIDQQKAGDSNLALQPLSSPTVNSLTRYDATTAEMDDLNSSTWGLEYSLVATPAGLGNRDAEARMGYLYENGHGVAKDLAQARTWYQKAADQGSVDATAWLKTHPQPAQTALDPDKIWKVN